jgi:septal ring factor EnvC (AmiA/AmiB activator)
MKPNLYYDAKLRDEIKDIKQAHAKTDQELMEVDESLAEIRKKKEEAEDNKREQSQDAR